MKASPMSMVGFPLLLIPLAIYNILVFLMPTVSFTDTVLTLTLMSGAVWRVTFGDMLLALAILMLLFEVIKGARPGAKYLTDHLLSLLVFGGAAAEFLLLPQFGGSSTFFLLTLLALVDFLTGIALRTRRGKRAAASPAVVAREERVAEAASPEPQFVPPAEPEPAEPAASQVVESAARDRPLPKAPQLEIVPPQSRRPEPMPSEPVKPEVLHPEVVQPEVVQPEVVQPEVLHPEVPHPEVLHPEVKPPDAAPKASSPEVASPGLRPGSASPASPDETPRDPKP
jgi:hypothetical protein